MLNTLLFLGLPVDARCAAALQTLNPAQKKLYIQEDANYLQEIIYQEQRYLGKKVAQPESLAALEMLQENIYSLLKKLMPHDSALDIPLQLFPIQETAHDI